MSGILLMNQWESEPNEWDKSLEAGRKHIEEISDHQNRINFLLNQEQDQQDRHNRLTIIHTN